MLLAKGPWKHCCNSLQTRHNIYRAFSIMALTSYVSYCSHCQRSRHSPPIPFYLSILIPPQPPSSSRPTIPPARQPVRAFANTRPHPLCAATLAISTSPTPRLAHASTIYRPLLSLPRARSLKNGLRRAGLTQRGWQERLRSRSCIRG
jgi:hypothetical protein